MANETLSINSPGSALGYPLETHEVSLRETFELLRAGRWTILIATAVVVLMAAALCLLSTPAYRSTGVVQVDDPTRSVKDAIARKAVTAMLLGSPVQTTGEVQILRSRRTLDRVIEQLHLDIEARPLRFPLLGKALAGGDAAPAGAWWGFGRWAWGGEQLLIEEMEVPETLLNQSLVLKVTADGYVLSGDWGRELLRGRPGQLASSADGRIRINVATLRARPGVRFGVTRFSHDDTVKTVLENLTVEELATSSGVIGISYTASSAERARDFVNALQAAYLQQHGEKHSANAKASKQLLEKQLPRLREQLAEAQRELSDYEREHGTPNVAAETQMVLKNSLGLNTRRLELQTELDRARQLYGPDNAKIKELLQAIGSVEREQARLDERIDTLPPLQQDVVTLSRDIKTYTQLYNDVNASMQNYDVAQAGAVSSVHVVDPASEPFKPYFPRTPVILLLALPLGLICGVLWIFVQRALLRGLDHPADIEQRTGVAVYAAVPYSPMQGKLDRSYRKTGQGQRMLAASAPEDDA
ncbi:MAG TPA: GNVR domain-containing protein, partial [Solimonas sp.]|nr:GNVR domain-containing protein [Solimonas sp.]